MDASTSQGLRRAPRWAPDIITRYEISIFPNNCCPDRARFHRTPPIQRDSLCHAPSALTWILIKITHMRIVHNSGGSRIFWGRGLNPVVHGSLKQGVWGSNRLSGFWSIKIKVLELIWCILQEADKYMPYWSRKCGGLNPSEVKAVLITHNTHAAQ